MRREQAGIEFSLRGQARPAAAAAEGLRYRGDEADLAHAVVETPALRHLAAVVLRHRMHRPAGADPGGQLARGDHHVRPPCVAVADVHELDETHDHRHPAKALHEIERGVIIHAALDDCVDLDGREPGGDRRIDALQNLFERPESAAHPGEDVLVQRVQAHGDALEAVGVQLDCMLRQQHAVGGERNILDAGYAGEVADQIGEIGAQQRLTAGEAQLLHAEACEQAREAHDLIERQAILRLQESIASRGIAPSACSTDSGSCSGPSRKCANRAAAVRADRADCGRLVCRAA